MYAYSGSFEDALKLFDEMIEPDILHGNVVIKKYATHWQCADAITVYQQMQRTEEQPNRFTLLSIVKACTKQGALQQT